VVACARSRLVEQPLRDQRTTAADIRRDRRAIPEPSDDVQAGQADLGVKVIRKRVHEYGHSRVAARRARPGLAPKRLARLLPGRRYTATVDAKPLGAGFAA